MQQTRANDTADGLALCDSCRFAPDAYNEMCTAPGTVRRHWAYLTRSFDALGPVELQRRIAEAQRLIRDNDVTYNIYTDPLGMGRPWELDLIPLLVESEEWSRIEAGLIQRAELLNLVLEDLYGARTTIKHGVLPAEAVFANPSFLHPCDGITRLDRRYLDTYAADLARSPDGQIWVIGDRTQAPSGAGYALENRMVLSRVLPSLFRDSHVHRLAGFFRALRRRLAGLAAGRCDNPRVVVLTPGADNETYFEHAYLANYLGYTLVEGSDLAVRDGRVWLKTLDALQRVDVILRRVDDEYCDPLELREESFLGVPGLVQSLRMGYVSVANPLGSGILQNPALMAFLPALARHFLGQDLRLPTPRTWWCGNSADRSYVLANLEQLVIKPMRPHPGRRTMFGAGLGAEERATLETAIRAQPHRFVAQESVQLSTVPVLAGVGRLEPRHVVLRSFLVAEEDSYKVMPGGLTRVSASADNLMVSSQQGGVSKDTWVLASEPERQDVLAQPVVGAPLEMRPAGEVPSRVAEDLFWVGRYAERAEGLARLLRIAQLHLTEGFAVTGDGEERYSLRQLLRAVTHQTTTYPGFVGDGADERLQTPEPELLSLMSDVNRPGSLGHSLIALLRAARSVRDRLSGDTWRVVNDIDQELQTLRGDLSDMSDALDELERLITALVAFSGLANENMTRGQGWRFLEMGRRLERALHTATLLRTTLVPVADETGEAVLLEAVLAVTDSLMTYRRRYRFGLRAEAVLELLLQDETNPRSIGYQLQQLNDHVERVPENDVRFRRSEDERLALRALSEVRLVDMVALAEPAHGGSIRAQLEQFLGRLGQQLPALSDALAATYFRHEEQAHQLVRTRPGARP